MDKLPSYKCYNCPYEGEESICPKCGERTLDGDEQYQIHKDDMLDEPMRRMEMMERDW